MAAGRHDLALQAAGDDRAAKDDDLGAVLVERLEGADAASSATAVGVGDKCP
jgi:hypothetical protein